MGMKKDLRLVGNNYQWLGSMFYFGTFYLDYNFSALSKKDRLPGMGVPG